MSDRKKASVRKVLRSALILILTMIAAGVLCLAMIIAQPQNDDTESPTATSQPLVKASSATMAQSEEELNELILSFPVPVLNYLSGSRMTFVHGSSYDAAFENGFGRIITLEFTDPDGTPVRVTSIYPARAYDLMEGTGWHFDSVRGSMLCGTESVRMKNQDSVRLHIVNSSGLYTVTVPLSAAGKIPDLVRSLQFFAVSVG